MLVLKNRIEYTFKKPLTRHKSQWKVDLWLTTDPTLPEGCYNTTLIHILLAIFYLIMGVLLNCNQVNNII